MNGMKTLIEHKHRWFAALFTILQCFTAVHESTNTTDWETPVIVSSVLICLIAVTIFLTLYAMYRRRHPWLVKVLVTIQARFIDDSKAITINLITS